MAKSDAGAIADALKEIFSWLKFWQKGAEMRSLKSAARSMQSYIKRNEKINPKARTDKTLLKYKKDFERKIV